jgi:hypothetical protein
MRILSLLLSLGFLLAPVPSWGALDYQLYEFEKLTGGLNNSFDAITLDPSEASDLQNIIFPRAVNGAIASRPGYTRINATALSGTPDCTGTFFFKLVDGTRYLVSVWTDDKIRKMDYGGSGPDGTWDDITGSLSFNVSTDNHSDFVIAENAIIIEDELGNTAPYKWTGTGDAVALTADSDVPNSKYVEYHVRHLFLAGDDANPSRLSFSALDDITNYTSTDFIRVETDSGDGVIQGLKTGLDGLYIWKNSSIWRLSGTNRDDFILERMVQGVGTLADSSISIVNDPRSNQQIFVFVTQNGDVAAYDGGVNVAILSYKIKAAFPNALNFSRLDEFRATAYENMYMVAVSSAGEANNDFIYVFDFIHNAWTRLYGMSANAVGTFENQNGKALFMFGDLDGFVNQWDLNDTSTLNDPGTTAIDSYYVTGWIPFKEAGLEKNLRSTRIWVNQEGTAKLLDVEIRKDFENTGSVKQISLAGTGALWDSAIYDVDRYGDLTVKIGRIEPGRGLSANVFQVRMDNGARASERMRIRRLQFLVEPSKRA